MNEWLFAVSFGSKNSLAWQASTAIGKLLIKSTKQKFYLPNSITVKIPLNIL